MASSVSSAALRLPKLSPAILEIMRRRMQANRLTISKVIPNNLHEDTTRKKAAIFVTLCNQNDNPSILLTLRSENLGTHKGQVSFPGGHLEIGETAEKASIRETIEELGNGVGPLRIIGECQTVPAITGTLVTPFVGFIEKDVGDLKHINFNTNEVDSVFIRPIALLNSPTYVTFEKLERAGQTFTMPIFGKDEGKERIWGLTAMVIHGVLKNLIIPSFEENYKRL